MLIKAAAALAVSFMLVSATPAQEGRNSSSIPPERFRATGGVFTVMLPYNKLYEACGIEPVEGMQLHGCAFKTAEGIPVVIVPDPCPFAERGEWFARIQCHEAAHALGGWGPSHEI